MRAREVVDMDNVEIEGKLEKRKLAGRSSPRHSTEM